MATHPRLLLPDELASPVTVIPHSTRRGAAFSVVVRCGGRTATLAVFEGDDLDERPRRQAEAYAVRTARCLHRRACSLANPS